MPVLYRKHRPQTFEDVVGQSHVTTTLVSAIAADRVAHAYLFSGPRGVGKTTTARLLAKAVNCEAGRGTAREAQQVPCNACPRCIEITEGRCMDVMEIDAATYTGIDAVREHIIETARFAPSVAAKKVFIIDEVHMLSTSSFNALLKTIEEPPDHVHFILATTELQKVPATITSRCQHFMFRRVDEETLVRRLERLAGEEGIAVERDILDQVVRIADGSVRDAESLLGQLFAAGGTAVDAASAALVLPRPNREHVRVLLDAVGAADAAAAIAALDAASAAGCDADAFCRDTIAELRAMTRAAATTGRLTSSQVLALRMFTELPDRLARSDRPFFLIEVVALTLIARTPAATPAPRTPTTHDDDRQSSPPSSPPPVVSHKPLKAKPATARATASHTSPSAQGGVSMDAAQALATVQRAWHGIVRDLASVNRAIPYLLEGGRPQTMDGTTLTIGFRYKLHAEKVRQPGITDAIIAAITNILGVPIRLEQAVIPPDEFQALDRACRPATGDTTADAALEVFGSRVLDEFPAPSG
ncbi:MAG: DNA polymerase III subunit gamma/tau [bacterium]|nr:DNA polymerase III subunit gamma/tau [bacterium]